MHVSRPVSLMVMLLMLAGCKSQSDAAASPTASSQATIIASASPVEVPSLPAVDASEEILAKVPLRTSGGYSAGPFVETSGSLNAYFACTGGGPLIIALGDLVTYTESCSASRLTTGQERYEVSSRSSVLLRVEAHGVTGWSFVLTHSK